MFAIPEQVRDTTELTTDEKIEILWRWAYDASETAVATEEGMPDAGRDDLQRRILLALGALGHKSNVRSAAPTKQHGLPR